MMNFQFPGSEYVKNTQSTENFPHKHLNQEVKYQY